MSFTYTEMALLNLPQRGDRSPEDKHNEAQSARQAADTMRELLGDPRWDRFCHEVEALKAEAQALEQRGSRDLVEKVLTPDQYMVAKVIQARGKGALDAYKSVLEIISNLIKQGERANKELANG